MKRLTTIEIFKEDMHFCAGHFTIFSASKRENLHGHTYHVYAAITTEVGADGLGVDYNFYKQRLRKLCDKLDDTVLLPTKSPHLAIKKLAKHYKLTFAGESFSLLKRDVTLLPVANITVEELSYWIGQRFVKDKPDCVQAVELKVFSGEGQSGSYCV